MPLSYKDPQFFESPRVRVVITQINPDTGTAVGVTRGGDNQYIIDLTVAVGPIWHVPAVGEEWVITRAANAWTLERMGNLQSLGYAKATTEQPGTSVINKDLAVVGDVSVLGNISNSKKDWIPQLTSLSAIGGITSYGSYIKIGDLVLAEGKVESSGSFTSGSGRWTCNLPVPAHDTSVVARGYYFAIQGTNENLGTVRIAAEDEIDFLSSSSTTSANYISSTFPWTWTSAAMSLSFSLQYLAA
jgi:hypothetical protein